MENSVICLSPPRTERILWSNLAWRVLAGLQAPLPHLLQIYKVPFTSYIKAQEYRNLIPKIARRCGLKLSREHQYVFHIALQGQPAGGVPFLTECGGGGEEGWRRRSLPASDGSFSLHSGKTDKGSKDIASSTKRLDISKNHLPSHIH